MQEEAGTPLTSPPPLSRPARAPVVGRSRLYAAIAGTAVVTVVADQVTKMWALRALTPGLPRPLIGDWIQLNLIRNSGAAFSLGNQVTWLLTALALVIVAGVLVGARRVGHRGWALTFGLLLGGALGNLLDRVFREPGLFRGHVVDFLDYFGLFIGNVTDIAIVLAAALVALLTAKAVPLRGSPGADGIPAGSDGKPEAPHE